MDNQADTHHELRVAEAFGEAALTHPRGGLIWMGVFLVILALVTVIVPARSTPIIDLAESESATEQLAEPKEAIAAN